MYNIEGQELTTLTGPVGGAAAATTTRVRTTAVAATTTPRTTAAVAATTSSRAQPQGGGVGGGAGTAVTLATLQVINGYNPPPSSQLAQPTNFSPGTIVGTGQIPGWSSVNQLYTGGALVGGGGNKISAASKHNAGTFLSVFLTAAAAAGVGAAFVLA